MILRVFIVILFACSYASGSKAQQAFEPSITASSPAPADFNNIVVPITAVKITPSIKLGISGKSGPALGIGAAFGTGFCLDPACHFIATNYHVAVTTQGHKVKREKIIQRYLATGPRHRHHSADKTQTYVTGCTQSIQDGINLTDEKDNQIYSIVTNSKSLKAGERITLKGVLVPRWSWKSDFSNAKRDQRLWNLRDSFRIRPERCEPNIPN